MSRFLSYSGVLLLVCGVVSFPRSALAARIGVLPLDGPAALSGKLDAGIKRALEKLGQRVALGPAEIRARLAKGPKLAAAAKDAREQLAAAEKAATYMRREEAITQARRAIERLEGLHARYHSPKLLAQAYQTLALALLLKPTDEDGALVAFHSALEVDPDLQVDPARLHPTAARVLRRARKRWDVPQSPSSTTLTGLARSLEVTHLVWYAARQPSGSTFQLRVVIADARGQALFEQKTDEAQDEALEATAWMVASALSRATASASQLAASRPTTAAPPAKRERGAVLSKAGLRHTPRRPEPRRTPLYRRWWFWTAVGAVVVGATIGVVASQTGGDDRLPAGEAGTIVLE